MPDYDSPFFITNDRADIDQTRIEDGSAVVWKLSDDAKLRRSPERQYCGNYVTYGSKGGTVYRHNADTHALIAAGVNQHRDMTSSFPLVKTKTKAQARGDRQLLDVQEQDVRITTRLVNIPSTRVTLAKAGMRLQVKGTHWWPSCDTWHYARIVTAQPMPHADGTLYDIDLELVLGDESDGPPAPDFTGNVFAGLQRTVTTNSPVTPGPVGFDGNYDPNPYSGWESYPVTGPLELLESSFPWLQIRATEAMTVRLHARAQGANVYIPAKSISFSITVNGVIVGTHTASESGFSAWTREVDLRDYHLDAGDIVSVSGTNPESWGNVGVNDTFLHVTRGYIVGSGSTYICDGP